MKGVCTLDKICIKNVRSLKDTGLISLSPITLLLGVNSSGKSTFLRAFPLLKQSISKRTDGPLLWAGDYDDYVDFGSFSETVTNGNTSDLIEFQFEFIMELENHLRYGYSLSRQQRSKSVHISYVISIGHRDGKEYVSSLKVRLNETLFEFELEAKKRTIKVDGESFNVAGADNNNYYPHNIPIGYRANSNVFDFALPSIDTLLTKIIDQLYPEGETDDDNLFLYSIHSQLIDTVRVIGSYLCQDMSIEETRKEIKRRFSKSIIEQPNSLLDMLTSEAGKQKYYSALFKLVYFYSVFFEIDGYLNTYFQQVHYIAPLRATAERYYRLRNLSIAEVDYQGKNLAIFLNGLTQKQLANFQRWTHKYFGFKVVVQKNAGHLSVNIALDNSKQPVNLSDTGFGYSQILPIITQLWHLSSREDISRDSIIPLVIAIEQPELHLHPALQAKLTKAFIAALKLAEINGYQLQLILETHSETIVNYLGRSIATGAINKDDVSVVLFEKESGSNLTSVNVSNFDSNGFLENWPIGFFAPKE